MTRNEILAMEPGPEMDALIAERVMGAEADCDGAPSHGVRSAGHDETAGT